MEEDKAKEHGVLKELNKYVFCRFQVEGWHQWPAAKDYLQYPHRHMFHFDIGISVTNNDREVEFIEMKRQFKGEVARWLSPGNRLDISCEELAERCVFMAHRMFNSNRIYAEVSEDGENGACVQGAFE